MVQNQKLFKAEIFIFLETIAEIKHTVTLHTVGVSVEEVRNGKLEASSYSNDHCLMKIRFTRFIRNLLQNSGEAWSISSSLHTLLTMTVPTVPWNLQKSLFFQGRSWLRQSVTGARKKYRVKKKGTGSSFWRQENKNCWQRWRNFLTLGNKIMLFQRGASASDTADLPFFSCWRVTTGSKILVSAGGSPKHTFTFFYK